MPHRPGEQVSQNKDFIYLGGGAAPRPREKPDLLLTTKLPPRPVASSKFKELLKKFEHTKKLDLEDFNSAHEIGQFVDFYNNTVVKKRQTEYEKAISDRNEYYWKLWIKAMEESR